ncbi:RepB family plasmid replication initiator protein [Vibrio owensii]|uniref:RepB family plasmid replication initiator protein n=1 Tax=Vibrio owensii TaxID=696485 RepID=A0AAU9Q786_9VIBR|nr:RepB family plasmid replication initiator protein [Vibrio owensii]
MAKIAKEALPIHIKKGHQLVFSRQDLSAREADMFALMVAHMSPEDWDSQTPEYTFSAHQLSEWLNIESKHVGYTLDPVAERLAKKTIGIRTDANNEREFDHITLFKRIYYKNRMLTMIPNDELRSEYIEYKQGFALINTHNYLALKKEYAKRLYELLSRFKSGGTSIHKQSLDDLRGLFGILDERGRLKDDKKSFKNNSVLINRCIKSSIEEISTNLKTKKEITFLDGNEGHKGFNLIKRGRTIVGIEFLYKWIGDQPIEEMNHQAARDIIKKLELKRLQTNTMLEINELKSLSMAYHIVGDEEVALKIERAIEQRMASDNIPSGENLDREDDEYQSIKEKIEELKQLNGAPDY